MKRIIVLAVLMILATVRLVACEIRLSVQEATKKEIYSTGDTVIVQAQVQLIHRGCPVAIKKTRFTYENLKIAGATEWKEIKPGLFTRQIKVVITEEKAGQAKISAVRTCGKKGGYAVCLFRKL
jgi:hypothetical protein